jgi:thiol-disulfide isomerase/thioredoxin
MKKSLPVIVVVALVAIAAGVWAARSVFSPPAAEAKALNFTLPDMQGKMHSLSDWRNKKVVVLNFWATWCPPCRAEIPDFIQLQKTYGNDGVQVIGVAVDNLEDVSAFYQSEGMNYPVLIGEQDAINIMAEFGEVTGSLPYSVVLNSDGKIVAQRLGALDLPRMEALIKPYVGNPPSATHSRP